MNYKEVILDIKIFLYKPIRFIQHFYNRIKNIIYWMPVIWNDEDFDYNYLFIIMRHKLISMRDFFNSDSAVTLYAEERAKEMDICIKILNRIIEDDYHENALMWHDKKWGKNYFKEKSETERKEFLNWMELADDNKKQDIIYLNAMLEKHIFKWWD